MPAARKSAEDKLIDAQEIIRQKQQKINLQAKEIKALQHSKDSAESIRKSIYDLNSFIPSPPDWTVKERDPKITGVPMAMWSDWHHGEVVFPEQVGGVNKFNRAIGKQRVKKLVDVLLDLTLHHMVNPNYPGIIVCLGGDMITGTIHEELRETNDGPVQVAVLEVQELLIWALTIVAEKFGNVFVPCVIGNHGRNTIKPRAKNRVYDSYEWNIYHQLKRHFEGYTDPISGKHVKGANPNVKFLIPDETDAYFTVMGHRFLLTHGDTLGVRGGDGIIGALGPIARGTIKVGREEAQIGRDFDTLLIGHWHTYIPRNDAVHVVVNGALKGYDEYARLMLRVPYSRPSQALWFIHQKYGFTAQWPMYLDGYRQAKGFSEWVTWQQRRD